MHTCLGCKKEVKEDNTLDAKSIINSGYCTDCLDIDFTHNPKIWHRAD
jgi:hypothetical protein